MTRPSREDLAYWRRMAENGDIEALECDPIVLALLDMVAEYEKSITWETTCLNCPNLLDKLYAADMKLEHVARGLDRIEKYDVPQGGYYGRASEDAVALIRDILRG